MWREAERQATWHVWSGRACYAIEACRMIRLATVIPTMFGIWTNFIDIIAKLQLRVAKKGRVVSYKMQYAIFGNIVNMIATSLSRSHTIHMTDVN
eukprot:scaffold372559_cov29-Prasinocladus_malaysianus.AAC.2